MERLIRRYYAVGKRRNASAREVAFAKQKQKQKQRQKQKQKQKQKHKQKEKQKHKQKPLNSTTAVSNSPTIPAVGDNTAATSSTHSRPDVMIRQAGLWTRFWLFIGCLSPEYQDGYH
ncbi:hypothetical protein BDR07DRAFT_1422238 [Suillus spraguei]|nr:hypothetical protein BDR07DRAFT_1422238 [Suillus spraguei]